MPHACTLAASGVIGNQLFIAGGYTELNGRLRFLRRCRYITPSPGRGGWLRRLQNLGSRVVSSLTGSYLFLVLKCVVYDPGPMRGLMSRSCGAAVVAVPAPMTAGSSFSQKNGTAFARAADGLWSNYEITTGAGGYATDPSSSAMAFAKGEPRPRRRSASAASHDRRAASDSCRSRRRRGAPSAPLRTRLPLGSFVVGRRAARTTGGTHRHAIEPRVENLISTQKTARPRPTSAARGRGPTPFSRVSSDTTTPRPTRAPARRPRAPRVERLEDGARGRRPWTRGRRRTRGRTGPRSARGAARAPARANAAPGAPPPIAGRAPRASPSRAARRPRSSPTRPSRPKRLRMSFARRRISASRPRSKPWTPITSDASKTLSPPDVVRTTAVSGSRASNSTTLRATALPPTTKQTRPSGSRATQLDRIELPRRKVGGGGQSGDGVTFFALTRGGVLTSKCENACSVGFGGVGPSGVSGALRCAGVAKALFGSPLVAGVAGASSKLTLEIVCVRLAIKDGGLGSVADILRRLRFAASARGRALIQKISKCKNLRLRARVGISALCWVVPTSQVRVENGRRYARYEALPDKKSRGLLVSYGR